MVLFTSPGRTAEDEVSITPMESAKGRLEHIQSTLGIKNDNLVSIGEQSQIRSRPHRLPLHTGALEKPFLTPLNPVQFLLKSMMIYPQKTAVIDNRIKRFLTYQEFGERVMGLAYALQMPKYGGCQLGNHESGRVAQLLYNTSPMLEADFAIPAIGGLMVQVNTRLKSHEIEYILEHSKTRVLIVDSELFKPIKPIVEKLKIITIISHDTGSENDPYEQAIKDGLAYESSIGNGKGFEGLFALEDENREFAICYTSGTTSRPKGVVTTFRGTYLAALANVIESGLTSQSVYMWTNPMFHAGGWTFPWALTSVGATHVCLKGIDYTIIWDHLLDTNINISHYNAAPTVNIQIVNHPKAKKLDRPVLLTIAGAPPTAHLLAQLRRLNIIPVHVYGLTETYGPSTKSYHQPYHDKLNPEVLAKLNARQGHGFITSDEVRVVDPLTMLDVPWDGITMGEIIFRGNIVMKGYLYDEEATKKAFKNGWFLSGDVAVRHPDGYIEIRDRSKDIIISGGENISTIEVENVLASHPCVLEVCCVAKPHLKWGETPKAYIVVHDKTNLATFPKELITFAKSKLAGFKVPSEIQVVKELPKNSTGKYLKYVLRERARNEK